LSRFQLGFFAFHPCSCLQAKDALKESQKVSSRHPACIGYAMVKEETPGYARFLRATGPPDTHPSHGGFRVELDCNATPLDAQPFLPEDFVRDASVSHGVPTSVVPNLGGRSVAAKSATSKREATASRAPLHLDPEFVTPVMWGYGTKTHVNVVEMSLVELALDSSKDVDALELQRQQEVDFCRQRLRLYSFSRLFIALSWAP
jgi:hypothetical protein